MTRLYYWFQCHLRNTVYKCPHLNVHVIGPFGHNATHTGNAIHLLNPHSAIIAPAMMSNVSLEKYRRRLFLVRQRKRANGHEATMGEAILPENTLLPLCRKQIIGNALVRARAGPWHTHALNTYSRP
jgi:hypothetical protein